MAIYIIGAGAIGKVLAVSLQLAQRDVVLLRGSLAEGAAYTEKIQVLQADGTLREATVPISTINNFGRLEGIVVLTNKSYGNAELARRLQGKTGKSPLVLLQNGLGVEQPFIDNGFPEIYRCVLFVTSQAVAGDPVRYKPVAVSPVGVVTGGEEMLYRTVAQLDSPGFRFGVETDITTIVWKKAIINCVFNSICPLIEADNGIFHRNADALAMAGRVVAECLTIAAAKAITLHQAEVMESLLHISRSSDGQLISTFQDIRHKRETEIDTLNLEIARIAQTLGKADLVKETRLLGELTKLKSELGR